MSNIIPICYIMKEPLQNKKVAKKRKKFRKGVDNGLTPAYTMSCQRG